MGVRGDWMGVHVAPGNATHLAKAQAVGARWARTWAWGEYQWMCSTPDNTSSRGTLSTATEAGEIHGLMDAGIKVVYPFLGVPRAVNPRAGNGTGDGSYHRFAVSSAGRALYAADAVTIAQAFFTGYEDRAVWEWWNEPNIVSFSKDQGYNGGAEATAAVFAAMIADGCRALRAAMPTLPQMIGSPGGRGDVGNRGTGESATYVGDTFALAVVDWLLAHAPDAVPDLAGFHPYIYTTGRNASLDDGGTRSSSPKTTKGWNGHIQMGLFADGLAARGCVNRGDTLLGTGQGASRLAKQVVSTESGEPSRDPADTSTNPTDFDEGWAADHHREEQEVIYFRQVVGQYHALQCHYTIIDTASPTASSATADLHDYFGLFKQSGATKPAATVFAEWAAKPYGTGTDPVAPIVVPDTPAPPAVTSRISGPPSIYSILGPGLVHATQWADRAWTRDEQHPRRNSARGVLLLGGAGGWGMSVTPGAAGDVRSAQLYAAVVHALKARPGMQDGYTFLNIAASGATPAPLAGWGNDASMDLVDSAVAAFQANGLMGGAAPGRIALVGVSMGHITAVNWTLRNPTKVAGVCGLLPASSLLAHYNGGQDSWQLGAGGFPTAINDCYGLTTSPNDPDLDATVLAERDPLTRAAELAGVPWGLSYAVNDPVVERSTVEAFIAAKGGLSEFSYVNQITAPAGQEHLLAPIGETDLLTWLDSCRWS